MNTIAKKILLVFVIMPLNACLYPPFHPPMGGYIGVQPRGYYNNPYNYGNYGYGQGGYQAPHFHPGHHGWGHGHR